MLDTTDLNALYAAFIFAPCGEVISRAARVAAMQLDALEGDDAPESVRPTIMAPTARPEGV